MIKTKIPKGKGLKYRSKASPSFLDVLNELCEEKGVNPAIMFEAIEQGLILAYKRNFNSAGNVRVEINRIDGTYHVYAVKNVVDEVYDDITQISLGQARAIKSDYEIGDVVEIEVTPADFGRIAAQAAKQTVTQRLRDAERDNLYNEYIGKLNDIVSGIVLHVEHRNVFVDLGNTEAMLPYSEIPHGDECKQGKRIKAIITDVKKGTKGSFINLSRTHPIFLRKLFELNVPEIADGTVEIKAVVREAGSRSKIAVFSADKDIDPIGACIGPKGIRVQAVTDELGAEKIDIVEWSENPEKYIANALAPSEVLSVTVLDDEEHSSSVVVPDNQLSLAIGKEGQNARLAARLTGWKIDIKSQSQSAESAAYESDDYETGDAADGEYENTGDYDGEYATGENVAQDDAEAISDE